MDKPRNVEIKGDAGNIFVVVDGVPVAKRAPEADTWTSLKPGWTVTSNNDHSEIEITHDGTQIH